MSSLLRERAPIARDELRRDRASRSRCAERLSARAPALALPLAVVLALALALAIASAAGCRAPEAARLERFEYERMAMGSRFAIALYARTRAHADAAAEAAFARIDELDGELSDFDAQSELSRLSERSARGAPTEPVALGDDLWAALAAAQEWSRRSDGAFDATVGPYVRLWRQARVTGELPARERFEAAARSVGWRLLELDASARTARLLAPDMRLDLGGIAKGIALDAALEALARAGVERALVDAGGQISASGPPPGRDGWSVRIEPWPDDARGAGEHSGAASVSGASSVERGAASFVTLAHASLATSGDASRFVELDGVRYSHIVDPRTGLGLTTPIAASVLAPDGTSADALATALCVLGPERGLALAASVPRVDARIVVLENGRPRVFETREFGAPRR